MNTKRISGFQWAMTIFIFYVIAYFSPIILKGFQYAIPYKRFVFDMSALAPFIAAIVCIVAFKNKSVQLAGLKLSISLKVIERILIALTLPLIIYIICMWAFNTYSDSFIILQAKDLSVSLVTILVGHIVAAFFIEFGFRSYLQNMVETKVNTFFASIIVGVLYSIWNINTTFGQEYMLYNVLYSFSFSMIIGELIRATKGRSIYIAVIFHAFMSYVQVFFFSEETGDLFSMKTIALATAGVGAAYILLTLIVRAITYLFTRRSINEIDDTAYTAEDNTSEATTDEDVTTIEETEANETAETPPVATHAQDEAATEPTTPTDDVTVQEQETETIQTKPSSAQNPKHPHRR